MARSSEDASRHYAAEMIAGFARIEAATRDIAATGARKPS